MSSPDDEVKLRMDREIKEVNRNISSRVAHDFLCIQVPAIRIDELPGLLVKLKPELLHFSGHGRKSELCFEDKDGNEKSVSIEALSIIFRETGHFITCLFINACKSADIAKKIRSYIPYVIGFPGNIRDDLSEIFSKVFYETLSLGQPVRSAFELAKSAIHRDIQKGGLPLLYENKNLNNYTNTIFRDPVLAASFELERNKPEKYGKLYRFSFNVLNLPANTSYITYEFIDDEIEEDNRYALIQNLSSGTDYKDWLGGNIIIRAWLWMDDKKYGIGIESNLKDALNTYYKNSIPANCKAAFNYVTKK